MGTQGGDNFNAFAQQRSDGPDLADAEHHGNLSTMQWPQHLASLRQVPIDHSISRYFCDDVLPDDCRELSTQ